MTDGEKMIYAAAFAARLSDGDGLFHAAAFASNAVVLVHQVRDRLVERDVDDEWPKRLDDLNDMLGPRPGSRGQEGIDPRGGNLV